MAQIKFNIERCKSCELCVAACPRKLITMSDDYNPKGVRYACIHDTAKCTACGMCYRTCPDLVIEIEK